MKQILMALVLTTAALLAAPSAFAECSEFVIDDARRPPDDAEFAAQLAALAERARDAACLEQADRLLEGAQRLQPNPAHVYARILVREQMGDFAYAQELLNAYRDELAADPDIHDLVEVDARLREKLRNDPEPIEAPTTPVPARRSTLDTVGPIVMGVIGAASLGLAVYGLTASCDLTASDGTCLRGDEVAPGPTIAYSVTGVLALTTAGVWWIIATPRPSTTLALTPSGFAFTF